MNTFYALIKEILLRLMKTKQTFSCWQLNIVHLVGTGNTDTLTPNVAIIINIHYIEIMK